MDLNELSEKNPKNLPIDFIVTKLVKVKEYVGCKIDHDKNEMKI